MPPHEIFNQNFSKMKVLQKSNDYCVTTRTSMPPHEIYFWQNFSVRHLTGIMDMTGIYQRSAGGSDRSSRDMVGIWWGSGRDLVGMW